MPFDDAGDAARNLDLHWDQRALGAHSGVPAFPGDDADLIDELERRSPRLDAGTRSRIRQQLFSTAEGEALDMSTRAAVSGDRIPDQFTAESGPSRRTFKRSWIEIPALRIAAVVLLAISLVGAIAALRSDGDGPMRGITTYPAATTQHGEGASPVAEGIVGREGDVKLEFGAEGAELRLSLTRVTIEPGAAWSPFNDAASFVSLVEGRVTLTSLQAEAQLQANGDVAAFAPLQTPTIRNDGDETATVVVGMMLTPYNDRPEMTESDGVVLELLAAGNVHLDGSVMAYLALDPTTGEQTVAHSNASHIQLYGVLEGALAMTRLAGTIEVQRNGETPMSSGALGGIGDRVELVPGESFLAHSGSSYRLEPVGDSPAIVATLIVHDQDVSEPIASPVAESTPIVTAEGGLIEVRPTDCTITARSIDELAAIFADANGATPQANMYADAVAGTPADEVTIAGVTEAIVQIVACNSPASIEMYSVYSANALRFQAAHGMTIAEIESLPAFEPGEYPDRVLGHVAVEDVTILSDGRVTAMVNANGEIAFVTFVFEDGSWRVDFWDDSFAN